VFVNNDLKSEVALGVEVGPQSQPGPATGDSIH
jgi:hypothetical protein